MQRALLRALLRSFLGGLRRSLLLRLRLGGLLRRLWLHILRCSLAQFRLRGLLRRLLAEPPAATATFGDAVGDQGDGLLERHGLRRDLLRDGGVDLAPFHVVAVAAVMQRDRLAVLGMCADRLAG